MCDKIPLDAGWCVMHISLFLTSYNLTKGIVHISMVFLKRLRLLLLYLNIFQMFMTFNRTDASFFKQVKAKVWKKISYFFYIHCIKL